MNKEKEEHGCIHGSTIPNHLCEGKATKPASWQGWETSPEYSCQASQTTEEKTVRGEKQREWSTGSMAADTLHQLLFLCDFGFSSI